MGLAGVLAGDIGETGESESGEIGERDDMARSSYRAKDGMHVESSNHLQKEGKAQLWKWTSLVIMNKGKYLT